MFLTAVSIDAVFRAQHGDDGLNWVDSSLISKANEFTRQMLDKLQSGEFGKALRGAVNLEVLKVSFRARNHVGTEEGSMVFKTVFSKWPNCVPGFKMDFTFEVEVYSAAGGLRPLREVGKKELDTAFQKEFDQWWNQVTSEFVQAVEADDRRTRLLRNIAKFYGV